MLQYIIDGGLIMLILVGLSVVGLAVIIDRWRVFSMADSGVDGMRQSVADCLHQERPDDAIRICREGRGPAAAVLLTGLEQYAALKERGRTGSELVDIVTRTMSDYVPHVLDTLENRLNVLSMIGSTAPLLGMTGTVVGMMMSFNEMAAVGGLDGGAVAGGISLALTTTAAGLLVAIPSVVFHNFFSRRIDGFTLQIEETANTLINYITLHHE